MIESKLGAHIYTIYNLKNAFANYFVILIILNRKWWSKVRKPISEIILKSIYSYFILFVKRAFFA